MAFLPASWAQGIGVTPTFVPTYLENQKVKDSRFMSTRERKKQLCSASKIKHKKSTLWEANISTGYVFSDLFRLCPPSTLCSPQLQSTCHYIVNHYVKILHVHLGVANNMHPLSWGGTNGKDPFFLMRLRTIGLR